MPAANVSRWLKIHAFSEMTVSGSTTPCEPVWPETRTSSDTSQARKANPTTTMAASPNHWFLMRADRDDAGMREMAKAKIGRNA